MGLLLLEPNKCTSESLPYSKEGNGMYECEREKTKRVHARSKSRREKKCYELRVLYNMQSKMRRQQRTKQSPSSLNRHTPLLEPLRRRIRSPTIPLLLQVIAPIQPTKRVPRRIPIDRTRRELLRRREWRPRPRRHVFLGALSLGFTACSRVEARNGDCTT